jgi:hypothetical protein
MPTGADNTLDSARTVVLVEGVSDQLAVAALAARRGRNLLAEKVFVVPMGGATNIGHFLDRFGPNGANIRLAGLCDEAEVHVFQRGLAQAGLGDAPTRAELESRHFYVCAADLEDELIRALGTATVEQILDAHGDLTAFRTFQQQPAQQGAGQPRRTCGGSWGPGVAARSTTRRCWPVRCSRTGCPGRWRTSSTQCDARPCLQGI